MAGTETPGTPGSPASLLLEDVGKSFGRRGVLDALNARFDAGIHALVGPNGAGKSTCLRIAAGALDADRGRVLVCGRDLQRQAIAARRLLGYAPQPQDLYAGMSGSELLQLVQVARGLPPGSADPLVKGLGVGEFVDTTVAEMSEGTRRKFGLAAALLGEPAVLLLDEPSIALDEASLAFVADTLMRLRERHCIVMATHDLAFGERLGARVFRLAGPAHA